MQLRFMDLNPFPTGKKWEWLKVWRLLAQAWDTALSGRCLARAFLRNLRESFEQEQTENEQRMPSRAPKSPNTEGP
jgi:hypothetical protein